MIFLNFLYIYPKINAENFWIRWSGPSKIEFLRSILNQAFKFKCNTINYQCLRYMSISYYLLLSTGGIEYPCVIMSIETPSKSLFSCIFVTYSTSLEDIQS